MDTSIARMIFAGLVPVIVAVILYIIEKRTSFKSLSYKTKQVIIGICFGAVAIFSTEFSVTINGAAMNVRDAAPLAAGLIFGAPAGIIAGVIGGLERWFASLWGVGEYTRLACTIATIIAGLFGAVVRKLMLDNKKPSWFYAVIVGITTEVFHMLLVFLTNMNDIHTAFEVVKLCAGPMIAANTISVTLAVIAISVIGKEKVIRTSDIKKISQTFQRWLLICVIIAFVVTSAFTVVVQSRIAYSSTDELLSLNLNDVAQDINDASDENLMILTRAVAKDVSDRHDDAYLHELLEKHDVAEINIVNNKGIIINSTYEAFLGYDMASGIQSAAFMPLVSGKNEIVQSYQETSYDHSILRKYAGVALDNGGFVQVGYDAQRFQADIAQEVKNAAKNRHIGQYGAIIIVDENWNIVSDRDGREGENLLEMGISAAEGKINAEPDVRFKADVYGEESFCMYTVSEGYTIIGVQPVSEAMFSCDLASYIMMFMEIIVFAAIFVLIYFLIKKLVVENIQKINSTLAQITGGNLNVKVNVRSNEEFASLSDDINSTVVTLKHYIDEAAARIDRELEFARQIQSSALPSVFPPYPNRKDFDIFASMHTAKEVGGDFYDFYFLDKYRFAFLIADVSGKGIPAAMFMMTSKTLIKGFAESGLEVNEVFTRANEKLCEGNDAGMFVTAWMGILDLRTGLLTYANAGHNPPLIKQKGGKFEYLKSRPNFVLAGMEGVNYRKHELHLQPGDEIYLYTDGVTEAQNANEELFGEDRLVNILNSSQYKDVEELCKSVKNEVDVFAGDADQFDDITMLSVKLKSLRNNGIITIVPDDTSIIQVAEFIDRRLEVLDVPKKTAAKLKIAVDEIYSNIVNYSGANSAQVRCMRSGASLVLVFRDDGTQYNPLEAEDPDITLSIEERGIGGLGVFMVKKMMDSVEYEYIDGVNTLRLSLKLPDEPGGVNEKK